MMKKLLAFAAFLLVLCCYNAALAQDSAVTDEPGAALVAYFSCTGTTEKAAQRIAEATGADLYKIVPQAPYTAEDLNYNDEQSRANREMNDPDARPAIAGDKLTNMESYQVIYLGYPIWWGQAPRIISTFMESYDLGGKTIVPFCTSGSSGIGGSLSGLRALAPEASVLEGERLNDASAQRIAQWLESLLPQEEDAQPSGT